MVVIATRIAKQWDAGRTILEMVRRRASYLELKFIRPRRKMSVNIIMKSVLF